MMKTKQTQKLAHRRTRIKAKPRASRGRVAARKRQRETPPAYLVRMVGEAQAENLSNEIVIHHRRD
jgi:hypothetical protein